MTENSSSVLAYGAAHLRVEGISVTFGDRRVLTDVSVTVPAGARVGLIGENGSGKTTLLRIIAGLMTPDAGSVTVTAPGGGSPPIGLLHQEPPFAADMSVADALESAVAVVRAAASAVNERAVSLATAPQDAQAADDFAIALTAAERLGAWGSPTCHGSDPPGTSPVDSGLGCRWRGCYSAPRRCCYSTSQRTTLMMPPPPTCAGCCPNGRAR